MWLAPFIINQLVLEILQSYVGRFLRRYCRYDKTTVELYICDSTVFWPLLYQLVTRINFQSKAFSIMAPAVWNSSVSSYKKVPLPSPLSRHTWKYVVISVILKHCFNITLHSQKLLTNQKLTGNNTLDEMGCDINCLCLYIFIIQAT